MTPAAAADDTQKAAPRNNPEAMAQKWQKQLDLAMSEDKAFLDDGRKVVKRYESERETRREKGRRFNILYSNTEALQAALYGKTAKPDVRRRFSDRDPVGQSAAEILERVLIYVDDIDGVDAPIEAALQDYLLPGRGTVRIEYEPVIGQQPVVDPISGSPVMNADGEAETMDFIADQKIRHRYVYWEDMLVSPARRWAEVWWVAFRHTMTKDEIEEQIFENAPDSSDTWGTIADVPLDWSSEDQQSKPPKTELLKAEVFEIWNKASAERIWYVKGRSKPLRRDQDPYRLEGFWPLPEPLASYRTNKSVTPRAEFSAYQDQADDLDEITRRISILTKAMRRRGVYNQGIPELKLLANADDNRYIPVPNFNALVSKGGLTENFLTEDIKPIADVLIELYRQRDMLVQAIYELTGIADIMRGASDPDETLGAQQMKAQFGSQRLRRRQRAVQRWIRDLNRIKVDLICQHFEPEILQKITNVPITPEIMQVLRSDAMRCYRVDIETDSTIFQDAAQQQQERTTFISGLSQLFVEWAPLVSAKPQLMPLLFGLAEFGAATFPDSRVIQDKLEEIEQALSQPGAAAPPPDPKAQAAQAQAQVAAVEGQTKIQVATISAQAEAAKAQSETQQAAISLQATRDAHAQALSNQAQQHALEMQQMAERHAQDMQRRNLDRHPTPQAGEMR